MWGSFLSLFLSWLAVDTGTDDMRSLCLSWLPVPRVIKINLLVEVVNLTNWFDDCYKHVGNIKKVPCFFLSLIRFWRKRKVGRPFRVKLNCYPWMCVSVEVHPIGFCNYLELQFKRLFLRLLRSFYFLSWTKNSSILYSITQLHRLVLRFFLIVTDEIDELS